MKREEWMEYLEPETVDLMEAEALLWKADGENRSRQRGADPAGSETAHVQSAPPERRGGKRLSKRRWLVLLAACMLVAALGIAAAAAGGEQNGWFFSYFQVSGEKESALLGQMEAQAQTAAEDVGYRIEATESVSDGKRIYALLTVTAPEGAGFDERQYALEGMPWKAVSESLGGMSFLAGGGTIEEVGRPAQNQAAFLLVWDVAERINGQRIILRITGITAYLPDGSGEEAVAEGQWELELDIPEIETKKVRQWTRVRAGEENYYVTGVELTPLGARIRAVKAVRLSDLWKTAEYAVRRYVLRRDVPLPEGWGKEGFYGLPVSVRYRGGSEEEVLTQGGHGSFFSCEKSISFEQRRIVDPEEIEELRLGDVSLKIR